MGICLPTFKSADRLVRIAAVGCLLTVLAGCSNTPPRIDAPQWDPEAMADEAMKLVDKDSNGQLSPEEMASAPGLGASWKRFDENGDGQISRDELVNRVTLYADSRVGLSSFTADVMLDGEPLEDVDVKIVPEPFFASVVEEATGKAGQGGYVSLRVPTEDVPGARIGMYRVVVTGPGIPQKYQSADTTDVGVEISPQTEEDDTGMAHFELYSRG
ncbi:MAG: EF-hand domain-containing protein [Pirellulales bacterium]